RYNDMVRRYGVFCLYTWDWQTAGDANAPVTRVCCNTGTPFGTACAAPRPSCAIPANSPAETGLSCSANTPKTSEPVDCATGNTFIVQSDIRVPGLGGGLSLNRTWNSMLPAVQQSLPSMFGPGWRANYEERLIFNSADSFLKYARGDGSTWSFSMSAEGPP